MLERILESCSGGYYSVRQNSSEQVEIHINDGKNQVKVSFTKEEATTLIELIQGILDGQPWESPRVSYHQYCYDCGRLVKHCICDDEE